MSFDWTTLGLQVVNVLVLLWLSQRFLYRPVIAVLQKRQAEIDGCLHDADVARCQAEGEKAAAAAGRVAQAEAREQALAKLQADLESARTARLSEIQAQSVQLLEDSRRQLANERLDAETQLRRAATRLAATFARRILARVPAFALVDACLDELVLPVDTRNASPSRDAQFLTAAALTDDQKSRVSERLARLFPTSIAWHFDIEPTLLGGLEIRSGDTVITHTLAQDLAQLESAAGEHVAAH